MSTRIELQEMLEDVLGSSNVYFQPPETLRMSYPAIVYYRSTIQSRHANDEVYGSVCCYTVTVIDADPDSEIPASVSKLPLCRHDRQYFSDNLNHDVFTLYF